MPLALLIVILTGVVVYVGCGRLTPFSLTFALLAAVTIGYARLVGSAGAPHTDLYLVALSVVALSVGYLYCRAALVAGRRRLVGPNVDDDRAEGKTGAVEATRGLLVATAGISALAVYHFAVIGLPILSSNVEIERWDFTSSGLFGIPGRAYLYGLPVLLILCELQRRLHPAHRPLRALWWVLLSELVFTRIVGGFKGELFEIVIVLILLRLTADEVPSLSRVMIRYLAPIALALVFAANVGSLYRSAHRRAVPGTTSTKTLVVDRLTTGAASPGEAVFQMRREDRSVHFTVLRDIDTYVRSVIGLHTNHYLFVKVVSARIHGRDLAASKLTPDRFIVPTTPGGFPVLYYDFGDFAFLLMALLGAIYAGLEHATRNSASCLTRLLAIVMLVVLHDSIHKGDFATIPLNWLAMAGLVWALFAGGRAWSAAGRSLRDGRSRHLLVSSPR